MELHELSFAKIVLLRSDIAEVIINDGVEMDNAKVEQYHEFLLNHLTAPFSILVNKINSYSYDFEALNKVGTLKELKAIAVVTYTNASKLSTESVAAFPRETKWNVKMFSSRDEAMVWLVSY